MLAHHLVLGMAEAGLLLPLSLAGRWPELALRAPGWSADPHVIGFCQTVVVLLGVGGSSLLLRRLLQPDRWEWVGLSVVSLGLGLVGRWLVAA